MIDTHNHLLPGVDHGCPDMETSMRMLAAAAEAGVSEIVCTPHLTELDTQLIERARATLGDLRSAVTDAGMKIELRLGFEVDLNVVVAATTAELMSLAIEGSKSAILVETPQWGWPPFLRETIFRLSTHGFLPVLAHPERNERVQAHPTLLTGCLEAGAVAQATAASVFGEFGRSSRRAFYRHLFLGQIALLASDAHSHRRLTWTLAPLMANLRRRMSEDDLDLLVSVNPKALLEGTRPSAVMPSRTGSAWRKRLRRE